MQPGFQLTRTTTSNPDFQFLISLLDYELWHELDEDQATYDQHNKVPDIKTAVVVYAGGEPAACGCYKQFDEQTVEIKRMFAQKKYRGQGLSKQVLQELEQWATEEGFRFALLETSVHFSTAIRLYSTSGYSIIPNYPPYVGLEESTCMKKRL